MNCEFENSDGILVCRACRQPYKGKASNPKRNCRARSGVNSPPGPGSHLLRLLRVAHWFAGKSCGCEAYAAQMNLWGPDKCEKRIQEIVSHLVGQADKFVISNLLPHETKASVARAAVIEAIRQSRESLAAAKIEYVSTRQLTHDILSLAGRLPPDISGVVGIPRSGLIPASHLACLLHLPLHALAPSGLVDVGHGYRLGSQRPAGRLCVVDDTIQTGHSIRRAKKLWRKLGLSEALWVGCYVTPANLSEVDLAGRELRANHWLEWNWPNSTLSPLLATDFDGVLCRDLPPQTNWGSHAEYAAAIASARPLYLMRRAPVPLVVTARPEAMREATQAWCARHGVQVERLEMWPGGARSQAAIAAWKAEIYGRSNLAIYVESDPALAAKIWQHCRRPVLCPAAETVWQ